MYCDTLGQQDVFSSLAVCGATVELPLPFVPAPYPRLSKYLIELEDIPFNETVFKLNIPVIVTLYSDDGTWYCENQDFSSLVFGSTAEEAVRSFCEDFSVLWDEIAQAPDDTLTTDAQRVKRALISVVKTVRKTELPGCR